MSAGRNEVKILKVRRLTELALLTALALIIFIVEMRIPNLAPIPGVKLGLANIITVFAVYRYKAAETAMIVVCRVVLGAFFGGSMLTLLYSLAGAMLCLAGMLLLKRVIPEKQIWICSVFGAVLHNVGQLAVACIIAGAGMLAYFPFLLTAGCIAGAFTGGCAQLVILRNRKNGRQGKF